jgi:hypothetical protein
MEFDTVLHRRLQWLKSHRGPALAARAPAARQQIPIAASAGSADSGELTPRNEAWWCDVVLAGIFMLAFGMLYCRFPCIP